LTNSIKVSYNRCLAVVRGSYTIISNENLTSLEALLNFRPIIIIKKENLY